MREPLDQHHGRSTNSHFRLDSLLKISNSCFIGGAVRLVRERAAAHRARLTRVLDLASGGLELDSRSAVKLFCADKPGHRVFTSRRETSGTSHAVPLVSGDNSLAGHS